MAGADYDTLLINANGKSFDKLTINGITVEMAKCSCRMSIGKREFDIQYGELSFNNTTIYLTQTNYMRGTFLIFIDNEGNEEQYYYGIAVYRYASWDCNKTKALSINDSFHEFSDWIEAINTTDCVNIPIPKLNKDVQ